MYSCVIINNRQNATTRRFISWWSNLYIVSVFYFLLSPLAHGLFLCLGVYFYAFYISSLWFIYWF